MLTRDDEVMGYCVAASDTVSYEEWLAAEWWPRLRLELAGLTPRTPQDEKILTYILNAPRTAEHVTARYPAHLHINLLPELQSGGYGSLLLRHQLHALEKAGVSGVHLGVDARNEGVTGFYKKFGFVEIERIPSILMCQLFESNDAGR